MEAAPTALAKIKWKYYVIFVCLTFVNILILYFWCPEVSPLIFLKWLLLCYERDKLTLDRQKGYLLKKSTANLETRSLFTSQMRPEINGMSSKLRCWKRKKDERQIIERYRKRRRLPLSSPIRRNSGDPPASSAFGSAHNYHYCTLAANFSTETNGKTRYHDVAIK